MSKVQEEITEVGPRTATAAMRQVCAAFPPETIAQLEGLAEGKEFSETEEVFSLPDGVLVIKATYHTRTYRPHSTVEAVREGGEESSQAGKPPKYVPPPPWKKKDF